jgi:hypothetical protein
MAIEFYSWTVAITFQGGSDIELHEYAPLSDVEEKIREAVSEGLDVIKERAKQLASTSTPLVGVEVRVVPPYGGSGFWSDGFSDLDGLERVVTRLSESAVARARHAAGRRSKIKAPPRLEAQFAEFLSTVKEVGDYVHTGKGIGGLVASVMPGAASVSAPGPMAAMAAMVTGGKGGMEGLLDVVRQGLGNPEVIKVMKEMLDDPSKITDVMAEIQDAGEEG